MYIISQDRYFIMGMENLLQCINPYSTQTLIAFDRGDGKIIFFSVDALLLILGERKDFLSFIRTKFIKVEKNMSVQFLENELRKVLKLLKGRENAFNLSEIHLSNLEYNIIVEVLECRSNDDIAQILHLDRKIVSNYKNTILRKLGLNGIAELIQIYNNWNECFCGCDGSETSVAAFLSLMETNDLMVVND
ncbi:helix-turn-helix domain-containing protein [Salmonella enterica]